MGMQSDSRWPRFAEIPIPKMVALSEGVGSGTKVYQSFLDGHPAIYMVPGYPLMYFYPHWGQWVEEGKARSWSSLIDAFIYNHPSVLDSREMPGSETLDQLGDGQNEWLSIDQDRFRAFLLHLLEGEPICSRTFLLAVHFAYSFCQNEDLSAKTTLIFHIHVHHYIKKYLVSDFPDAKVIAFARDPRANCGRRVENSINLPNSLRLRASDLALFRTRSYKLITQFMVMGLDSLDCCPMENLAVVRHEDMVYRLEEVMRASAEFIGIPWNPCLLQPTFGGKVWKTTYYNMSTSQKVNPDVVSKKWKSELTALDWYLIEGVHFDMMQKYGYECERFKVDSWSRRLGLLLLLLLPSAIEQREFLRLISIDEIRKYVSACTRESRGIDPLRDYSRNSFYRHKWTNDGLSLHESKFYVENLRGELSRYEASKLKLRLAQALYVGAGLLKYLKTVLAYPSIIFQRVGLSYRAILRRINFSRVLPKMLP